VLPQNMLVVPKVELKRYKNPRALRSTDFRQKYVFLGG